MSLTSSHVDDVELWLPLLTFFRERRALSRATGYDVLFAEGIWSFAPVTFGPRGFEGRLFDIVKMEERETWTARFLRSGSWATEDLANRHRWVHVF